MKHKRQTNPPGRQKIIDALTHLLRAKDFHSITTAEIARAAGVTEGLIYKYFKNKKDLLYQVLNDFFVQFHGSLQARLADKISAIEKLEIIISASIEHYAANRVFARILLLEVRNSSDYFKSDAYRMVKLYAENILDIIHQGISRQELKADIDPLLLRKIIFGAIEHACLGEIIFSKNIDAQAITNHISAIIFHGAATCPQTSSSKM